MNERLKSKSPVLLRDVYFVSSQLIIHLGLLLTTLLTSGMWEAAIDSLKGMYESHGVISNPWRQFFPSFSLALGAFFAFTIIGFGMVRLSTSESPSRIYRVAIAFSFILTGSIASLYALFLASMSHTMFQDVLLGSLSIPLLPIVLLSLGILLLNSYKLSTIYQ